MENQNAAFTSDGWSKRTKSNYKALVLTSHYLDNDFRLNKHVISITNIFSQRSSDNISKIWNETIKKFKCTITAFTVDGGADMLASAKKIDKNALWCSCHRLHLISEKFYIEIPTLKVFSN